MTMKGLLVAFALAVAALAVSGSSAAQTSDDARAVELFETSATRYREGRFQEAIELLKEAYRLRPEPGLLYNRARAYEGLGDAKQATIAYRQYLHDEPNAADRGAIETRLKTIERQLEERESLQRQRDLAPTRARTPSPVPWVIAGVGVAG